MSRRASKRQAAVTHQSHVAEKVVRPEDSMLYKSPDTLENFKTAHPEAVKRLERLAGKDDEDKRKWLNKTTTRADVFNAMSIWQTKYLIPLAARLDQVEAYLEYLEMPFYRRWALRARAWIIWAGAKIAVVLPFKFRRVRETNEPDTANDTVGENPGDG